MVACHWFGTRRATARIEARLVDMPPAPVPSGRPLGLQTLEIVALFIVGPGLLLDIICSLFPHAFDHTPMMGRGMGPLTIAGLIVLAILAARRLLLRSPKRRTASGDEAPRGAAQTGDRVAMVAARVQAEASSE